MLVVAALGVTLAAGCGSSINVTRYRAPTAQVGGLTRIAVMPLMVTSAAETQVNATFTPFWMAETKVTVPMSPAQYKPAEATMFDGAKAAFAGVALASPDEVDAAMKDAHPADLEHAAAEVATRLRANAVLVVAVRNFNAQNAGLERAHASGLTDVTLYSAKGEVLWSLSGQVDRGPVGSNAAPSLTQFIEYAMSQLVPEMRQMMAVR